MKKRICILLVIASLFSSFPFAAQATDSEHFNKEKTYSDSVFEDVSYAAWYYREVANAYAYGLAGGVGKNRFNPLGNVTLAEAITFAARLHSTYHGKTISAVSGLAWYTAYVDYADTNSIIDSEFYTDEYERAATREELASILYSSVPEDEYVLINPSVYFISDLTQDTSNYTAILQMYRAGILTGSGQYGEFLPDTNITRAETVAIINRIVDPSQRKTFTQKIESYNSRLTQSDITVENTNDRVVVAAHRGYSSVYPENTMLAFARAIELGVDEIETDIQISKDGVPVIMHDLTLDRTTDGTGNLRDYTLAELKALDAGSWKNSKFTGAQIPSLEEFLKLASDYPGLLLNIEIKEMTHETVDKTMALLRKYNMDGRYVIASFDAAILKYAYSTYGVKCQGFPKEKMKNFDADPKSGTYTFLYSIGIQTALLTPESAASFADMGFQIWSYTPDDTNTVKAHLAAGSMLLTCNNPVPALQVLEDGGQR